MLEYAKGTAIEKQMGDIEYIEKMCYEFSKLIYDINTEHNKMYDAWMNRCHELEIRCSELENQIVFLTAGKSASEKPVVIVTEGQSICNERPSLPRRLVVRIKRCIHRIGSNAKRSVKKLLKPIARFMFRALRKIAALLGIKNMLKRTGLYRKLQGRGLIEKLTRHGV